MECISRGTLSKAKRNATHFYLVGHFYRIVIGVWAMLEIGKHSTIWRQGNLWSSEGGAFLEGLTGVHGEGGKDDSMGDAALNHEAALAPEGAKGDRSPSEVGA